MVSKNNIAKPRGPIAKVQHKFVGVRETLVNNPSAKNAVTLTTDTNGNSISSVCLNSSGLTAATTSSGGYTNGTAGNVDPPHLLWLNNQSANFQYFRITNARLIVVGNSGANVTGTLNVYTTSDVADLATSPGLQTVFVGNNGKSIDLSQLATKNLVVPMVIDSSWKKVTSVLNGAATNNPFKGTGTSLVNYNSVNDICFTAFSVQVAGGPQSQLVCSLQIIYDVEFKAPISQFLNA